MFSRRVGITVGFASLLSAVCLRRDFGRDDDDDNKGKGCVRPSNSTPVEYSVTPLGKSGRFMIFNKNCTEYGRDPDRVVVSWDKLSEYDSALKRIRGYELEKVENFAVTNTPNVTYKGCSANSFSFQAPLMNGTVKVADLKMQVYLFTSNCTSGPADSLWSVTKGSLKFNIEINNFQFSSNATFLDVRVEVKGSRERSEKRSGRGSGKSGKKKGQSYLVGGRVALLTTDKYMLDGVEKTMPTGFPQQMADEGKQQLKFRFEKGNAIVYDPIATDAQTVGLGGSSPSGSWIASVSVPLLLAVMTAFLRG